MRRAITRPTGVFLLQQKLTKTILFTHHDIGCVDAQPANIKHKKKVLFAILSPLLFDVHYVIVSYCLVCGDTLLPCIRSVTRKIEGLVCGCKVIEIP